MNLNIRSVHFHPDAKLINLVEKKISKLNQVNTRITNIDVFLKLDNIAHAIKDKIVEIKVLVPRHSFFVKHSCKSFEESFELALDSMLAQIKRKKDKTIA